MPKVIPNLGAFEAFAKGCATIIGAEHAKIQGRVGARAFEDIVNISPVLTGRFRGSNNVSLDAPDTTTLPDLGEGVKVEEFQPPDVGAMEAKLATIEPFHNLIFTNSLPYASSLDNGSSVKAPAGVYKVVQPATEERLQIEIDNYSLPAALK